MLLLKLCRIKEKRLELIHAKVSCTSAWEAINSFLSAYWTQLRECVGGGERRRRAGDVTTPFIATCSCVIVSGDLNKLLMLSLRVSVYVIFLDLYMQKINVSCVCASVHVLEKKYCKIALQI